ncbi:MAG: histidinol phosphatase [Flavobacteriales bacterium]|nr:histidinol phosphatase [Flavobacteriales bacterium]
MSFLSRLFGGKEEKLEAADLSVLGTDVHSHFIPGIDDGAKTMEDSLALLQEMQLLGYKKVITTPHIMSDFYRNTPEIILSGLDAVRKAAQQAGLHIQIEAAAEYYLDFDLEDKIKNKELLTFGNSYVLFEMPFIGEPQNLSRVVFEMQMAGYKPVLAHVERYTFWHNQWEKIEMMHDKGVILQLNLNSLSGHYSPATKKIAEKLIDQNMISLLGTDCHNLNHIALLKESAKLPYLHKALKINNLLNQKLA